MNQYTIHIQTTAKKSSHELSDTQAQKSFQCNEGQNILDAALAAGIQLPYACKTGGCGTCRGKIIAGEWQTTSKHLGISESNEGFALLCSTQACSDLVIEAQVVEGLADIPIRKLPSRVKDLRLLSNDIMQLDLQLPVQQSFNFLSGQYIDILLKDGVRRSYSIANLPNEGFLELHIRHLLGGLFTDALFKKHMDTNIDGQINTENKANIELKIPEIKIKDILRIEGPLGTFFLREGEKPIILLASGTGFAPIKSILKMMLQQKIERPTYLYWGGRQAKDIYDQDFCNQLAQEQPWFKFIPVLSNHDDRQGAWSGRTGFVHQAVLDDFNDLNDFEVYACGAPAMIQAAQLDFKQKGLPTDAFFADAFTNASTTV
jgi:CDP-4-dehydro-6-deoxyglucose reductase, E3